MATLSPDQLDECLKSAERFLKIADNLSQNVAGIITGDIYPCVVNGAFACELFLKAIIDASSSCGIPKSHRLNELFLILDQNIRSSIEAEYTSNCSYPLNDLLVECDNAFIEWRYAYEQTVESHFCALVELGKVLKTYARQLA